MPDVESDQFKFAPYRRVLDHKKVQQYLNTVIEGETKYQSPREMACNLWNRGLAGEFYPDKPPASSPVPACDCGNPRSLSSVPTCDLVKELMTREGISQWLVRHDDQYAVRFVPHTGTEHPGSLEPGPATILVVID
jgi:hypothetical protein